jgi:hypothetical protein
MDANDALTTELAERFPAAKVVPDQIYAQDDGGKIRSLQHWILDYPRSIRAASRWQVGLPLRA